VLFAKPVTVTEPEVLSALPIDVIDGLSFTSMAPGARVGYSGSPVTSVDEVP
jgi:hypothetical protein